MDAEVDVRSMVSSLQAAPELRLHLDLDPKFLHQLACEGLLRRFTWLDLSSGNFPVPREVRGIR